ncbi:glycosyltransferase family A protein [Candidatus Marifrigoribacter sp. Uisw_064]|jgi:glycosyltransferase involved in cell wall biosynthesis|uniref:glycosyltransferase family A protein n=1 Tax=Candidatus Marifrigoribacter sp. Uisw_064 TaxID=3230970 RepID=UPI003D5B5BD9
MLRYTTVVICLYNAENFIEETLVSLSNQTLKDFKLLVIDDCSSDKSLLNVKEFLKANPFMESEIIEFSENKGTAFIRNYALHKVTTPLMLFFDADDIAKPNLLEKLYNKINSNESYIAVSCYSNYIDSNSNKIKGGQYIGPKNEKSFLEKAMQGKLIFMLPPTLFKREYAIKAGGYRVKGFGNEKIRYQDLSEDLDLWSRMSDFYVDNKIMITVPEVLFYYRKNTNTLSASKDSLFAMQDKIRYIKFNLKRRRAGLLDVDFTEFISTLTVKEKKRNYYKDTSAYYYRKAGFLFVNKSYLRFVYYMVCSMLYNPSYIVDKIKSNFLKND